MLYTKKYIRRVFYDERMRFHDLSKIQPQLRKANSKILNFYSSVDNIGNYTPVLGIRDLVKDKYDVWCCHDKNIDWNFINSNYDKIIIGGAGLIHKSFTNFWTQFLKECNLPAIVWGVGGIFPKNKSLASNVEKSLLQESFKKCDYINLRDELTADYVGNDDIIIAPCPTLEFLTGYSKKKSPRKQVLYSSHEELLDAKEKSAVKEMLKKEVNYSYTDNIQYKNCGINRIVREYCKSQVVITTRLHGAIIAYGLGIPYLAISFDNKVEEFQRMYGNGTIIKDLNRVDNFDIKQFILESKDQNPDLKAVRQFGKLAINWIRSR